jgi:DNA-binding MarR family transcriptional regulator
MTCYELPVGTPIVVQMIFLGHRLSHLMERRLAPHQYNRTQAALIMILKHRPGLMAQDLASPARVEPPSVTRALQTLERRGLVAREPHPTDGRASLFQLTEAGREAATTVGEIYRQASNEVEASLAPEGAAALREAVRALLPTVDRLLLEAAQ